MNEFPNAEFLRMAHDIALCHHERYDGRGYPRGLAGGAIPLCGRIVALADVYDALTTKRVYKNAMDHDEARALIVVERNSHFDADVVDAFLQVEDEFQTIRSRYAENEPERLPHPATANLTDVCSRGTMSSGHEPTVAVR